MTQVFFFKGLYFLIYNFWLVWEITLEKWHFKGELSDVFQMWIFKFNHNTDEETEIILNPVEKI